MAKHESSFSNLITSISVIILFILWTLRARGIQLIVNKFDFVFAYTSLFLLRSSIASFRSWKYDPKNSPTRSQGIVVIVSWVLLLIVVYQFILPFI